MIDRLINDLISAAKNHSSWGEYEDAAAMWRKAGRLIAMHEGDWID